MYRYAVILKNDADGTDTILRVKAGTNTDAEAKALAHMRQERPGAAFTPQFATRLGRR